MIVTDVLVVEDEPDVRSSVAEILRGAGYRVAEAADGGEALAVLSSEEVGAVLLDLRMPRMDGMTLLERVQDPPPVIIVSAHSPDDGERARLGRKVVDVLKKPVHPDVLLDRLGRALERKDGA
jgi:DNA-binding response OmpR family regulator